MALSSQFVGTVIGYRTYDSKDLETGIFKTKHVYSVLVRQMPDKKTKLFTECALCEVTEDEQVLGDKLVDGVKVIFWQCERSWRDKNTNLMQTVKFYTGLELFH